MRLIFKWCIAHLVVGGVFYCIGRAAFPTRQSLTTTISSVNYEIVLVIIGLMLFSFFDHVADFLVRLKTGPKLVLTAPRMLKVSSTNGTFVPLFAQANYVDEGYMKKFETSEKVSGPIYALRAWMLPEEKNGSLIGAALGVWEGGEMEAKCLCPTDEIETSDFCPNPHPSHECGIYCFKNIYAWLRRGLTHFPVWGVVELSGSAIEHSSGYKAQHAKIVAIFLNSAHPDLILREEDVKLDFDVPFYTDFKAMCQEFNLIPTRKEVSFDR